MAESLSDHEVFTVSALFLAAVVGLAGLVLSWVYDRWLALDEEIARERAEMLELLERSAAPEKMSDKKEVSDGSHD